METPPFLFCCIFQIKDQKEDVGCSVRNQLEETMRLLAKMLVWIQQVPLIEKIINICHYAKIPYIQVEKRIMIFLKSCLYNKNTIFRIYNSGGKYFFSNSIKSENYFLFNKNIKETQKLKPVPYI